MGGQGGVWGQECRNESVGMGAWGLECHDVRGRVGTIFLPIILRFFLPFISFFHSDLLKKSK